jgi:hypothetical protein
LPSYTDSRSEFKEYSAKPIIAKIAIASGVQGNVCWTTSVGSFAVKFAEAALNWATSSAPTDPPTPKF